MGMIQNTNSFNIGIYGKRNVGKSTLMNRLLGKDISIVSEVSGTTSDPVYAEVDFMSLGATVFIDTAGLDEGGELGYLKVKKSMNTLEEADLAIYVMDIEDMDFDAYENFLRQCENYNTDNLLVINKIESYIGKGLEIITQGMEYAVFISAKNDIGIDKLRNFIVNIIKEEENIGLVQGITKEEQTVLVVIPSNLYSLNQKSSFNEGKLIKEIIDAGGRCIIAREPDAIQSLRESKVDLVITDSKCFKRVSESIPSEIPITTFSILYSRQKGSLGELLQGIRKLENLRDDSKVLIVENYSTSLESEELEKQRTCSLINSTFNINPEYDFRRGIELPKNIRDYDLVINCSEGRINKRSVEARIDLCKEQGTAITNSELVILHLNDVLERALEIFKK